MHISNCGIMVPLELSCKLRSVARTKTRTILQVFGGGTWTEARGSPAYPCIVVRHGTGACPAAARSA